MKIILDTNIIFSSLLNKYSVYTDILFDNKFDFIIPKYAYIELFKHKEKIIRFSKHTEDEVLEILYKLLKNVTIFDENIISQPSLKKAYELVNDVDEKDMLFVALTVELNGLLWTNDKILIKGLQRKGFIGICGLQGHDLVQIITQ
ncbi:MAG: PIN domain-containing protein [Candidatus Omnitrophota bacterium]